MEEVEEVEEVEEGRRAFKVAVYLLSYAYYQFLASILILWIQTWCSAKTITMMM